MKLFDTNGGICGGRDWNVNKLGCGRKILAGEPWIDEHLDPREISANDSLDNRRPFHVACAREKTKKDRRDIAKVHAVRAKHLGIRKRKGRAMPGGRDSNLKIKMDGTVVDRRTGRPIGKSS